MDVLIACEFSGVVRDAFLRRGHFAVSCDLIDTESPGPHIRDDVFRWLGRSWDLIIAHPPCTAVCVSGNRHYAGTHARVQGAKFIEDLWSCDCARMCIENPVGVINSMIDYMPKPQYIQPWMFGHGETKKTGLWTRGLPDLVPTKVVDGREQRIWKMPPSADRGKLRSVTFGGIGDAMSDQWGSL